MESGTLPPHYTIDTLMHDHESHPRNTLIADAFFRAGFIEAWGRGYAKIREAFEREKLQVPTFEQVRGGVLATVKRERFVAMQAHDVVDNVVENVVNNVVENVVNNDAENVVNKGVNNSGVNNVANQLTERQQGILKLIAATPNISATGMAQALSVTPRTIQRELSALQKHNIIKRTGTKGGQWTVLI